MDVSSDKDVDVFETDRGIKIGDTEVKDENFESDATDILHVSDDGSVAVEGAEMELTTETADGSTAVHTNTGRTEVKKNGEIDADDATVETKEYQAAGKFKVSKKSKKGKKRTDIKLYDSNGGQSTVLDKQSGRMVASQGTAESQGESTLVHLGQISSDSPYADREHPDRVEPDSLPGAEVFLHHDDLAQETTVSAAGKVHIEQQTIAFSETGRAVSLGRDEWGVHYTGSDIDSGFQFRQVRGSTEWSSSGRGIVEDSEQAVHNHQPGSVSEKELTRSLRDDLIDVSCDSCQAGQKAATINKKVHVGSKVPGLGFVGVDAEIPLHFVRGRNGLKPVLDRRAVGKIAAAMGPDSRILFGKNLWVETELGAEQQTGEWHSLFLGASTDWHAGHSQPGDGTYDGNLVITSDAYSRDEQGKSRQTSESSLLRVSLTAQSTFGSKVWSPRQARSIVAALVILADSELSSTDKIAQLQTMSFDDDDVIGEIEKLTGVGVHHLDQLGSVYATLLTGQRDIQKSQAAIQKEFGVRITLSG